uniref:Intracellular proteinase inhibitor BsuPI domain-containing protein n=1 Tax=uncultured Armatimonadetes bacterium TaxID=157466 RepID=A0A6J4JLE9_9BACT|nr:hypothetical protein AVDCRST_MAG63-3637 [uncultured Armatimonadetes bacterium]
MNHVAGIRGVAATTLAALLLAGAAAGAPARGPFGRDRDEDQTTTRGASRNLRASITTDRTQYPAGRAVVINMRLTNVGDQRVRIDNQYEYDVTVREARTGRTVWRQSSGQESLRRQRRSFRIEPRETRTYRELWGQVDQDGRRVRPGVYRIQAEIFPMNPVSVDVYLGDRVNDGPGRPVDDGWDGPLPTRPGRGSSGDEYRAIRSAVRAGDSRVRAGDRVSVEYTIVNDGTRPSTFMFTSGRQFDVAVRPQGTRRTIWRFSQDRAYTMMLTQLTLRPGERRTYTAEWRTARDLPEGNYDVVAYLTPRGADSESVATSRTTVYVGRERGGRLYRRPIAGRALRLGELYANGSGPYLGRQVTVAGVYRGRRGTAGSARSLGAPPVLRSDWVLQEGGDAIYVSGPRPVEVDEGETVTVTGLVRRTQDGRLYLECDRD